MTRKILPAYPSYKPTSSRLLGRLPAHWESQRLGNIVEMHVSNVDKHSKEEELPVRLCNYVDVYKNDLISKDMPFMRATASPEEIDKFRLRKHDVLITKDSETWNDIGVPALVTEPADDLISGYHLALLRPKGTILGPFLFRTLQGRGVAHQFYIAANGVTRYGLTHDGIRTVILPIPPLSEQAAIVRYLDDADQRIRDYVSAKERLITLLEEERQTVIHQAVTKGLDPNVRLKPSGVEWLGDVPAHWEVRKLRQCTSASGGMTPSMEVHRFWGGSVPWVTPKDMKQDIITDSSTKVTNAALQETALQLVEPPAVLMVVRGMILARRVPIARTAAAVTINQDMKALKAQKGTNATFLAHSLNAAQEAFSLLIDEAGHGTRRLPMERWRDLPIALPPPYEQVAIVEFLDKRTMATNVAIDRAHLQIKLMEEYRTRLIADVVTGKIDVRQNIVQTYAGQQA